MNYQDIYVVDDLDEAEQFRYEHNDEPVEVGTAVGYDKPKCCTRTGGILYTTDGHYQSVDLHCFSGIYYAPDHV